MSGPVFFSFVGSMAICLALIPALVASAGRLQILDVPADRKIHTTPIARVGGVGFSVGVFGALLLWAPLNDLVTAFLLGGLLILLFGVWDDRSNLNYKLKFIGQILAASCAMWLGDIRFHSIPFFHGIDLPYWLSISITMVFLLAVTNAINFSDGLDGLAGGLAFLSFGGMTFLAFEAGDHVLTIILVSVLGGLLGFMRFNTFPARVFMGDGGSQFLGLYLGMTAVLLMSPSSGVVPLFIIMLLLGLPILDAVGVVTQRIWNGTSPFSADKNHIHHKLLSFGLLHYEVVVIIYSVQIAMVSLAYTLRWEEGHISLATYLFIAGIVLSMFFLADRYRRRSTGSSVLRSIIKKVSVRQISLSNLSQIPLRMLSIMVPAFLLMSLLLPLAVPRDLALLAIGTFVLLLMAHCWFWRYAQFTTRVGLYIGTSFVVYLTERVPQSTGSISMITPGVLIFYIVLAVLVLLTIRFHQEKRFHVTPLDYLIVFAALVIPNLPELGISHLHLGYFSVKLIVLFFSYELLLTLHTPSLGRLRLVSVSLFLGLGVKSFF